MATPSLYYQVTTCGNYTMATEEWKDILPSMLIGINSYNPVNIERLEEYINFQVSSDEYNFEANLTLMKLYQFQPDRYNHDIALKILLKAVMAIPETHLSLLISVLPLNQQSNEDIKSIATMCGLLESCSFTEFWASIEENMSIIERVTGFREAVRHYIIHLLNNTYQTIDFQLARAYLGHIDDGEFQTIVNNNGWTMENGVVYIRSQEEHIKPKRILPKIDFDSVSNIISASRT